MVTATVTEYRYIRRCDIYKINTPDKTIRYSSIKQSRQYENNVITQLGEHNAM